MALRLFKKKDGSPSGFAKLLKGAGKLVAKVAPFAPVPFSGKIGNVLDKLTDKTNVPLNNAAPKQGETLADFTSRLGVGAGAAAAALTENVNSPAPGGTNPLVFGFAKAKVKTIAIAAAAIIGGYWLLKKTKILP